MARERDPLPELPQVSTRPILILLGIAAVFVAVSMAGLGGYYTHRAKGLVAPVFGAFPQPRLETTLHRTSQKTPAGRPAPVAIPIALAMAMVAARGAHAYDPPEGGSP